MLIFALAYLGTNFRSFFGRIEKNKKPFRNYLTFSMYAFFSFSGDIQWSMTLFEEEDFLYIKNSSI